MKRWLTGLFAGVLAGCNAAPPPSPPIAPDAVRFDAGGLPHTFEIFQAWKRNIRRAAAEGRAMELREPGSSRYEAKDHNRVRNDERTRAMTQAIVQRLEESNADGQESDAEFAARLSQLLPRERLKTLLDAAAGFGTASAALIDDTIAAVLLGAYGPADDLHRRMWAKVADAPTGNQPWPRGTLPTPEQARSVAAATDAIVAELKAALSAHMEAQRQRSEKAAADIARALHPQRAAGEARRVGTPARIEAFMDEVRMPELAAFYARYWGGLRAGEIGLAVDRRAQALGIAGNWDPTGEKRLKLQDMLNPAMNALGLDGLGTEEVAPLLAELIPDAETEWMAANWRTPQGQRILPVLERLIAVRLLKVARSQNVTQAALPGAEEAAAQAEAALRRDAALLQDPAVRRLIPYLERSDGVLGRILRLHADKVTAAARRAVDTEAARVDPILRAGSAL